MYKYDSPMLRLPIRTRSQCCSAASAIIPCVQASNTESLCETTVLSLQNIGSVLCQVENLNTVGGVRGRGSFRSLCAVFPAWHCFLLGQVTIDIIMTLTFSTVPEMNNFFVHDGSPPVSYFSCDASRVVVGTFVSKDCIRKQES